MSQEKQENNDDGFTEVKSRRNQLRPNRKEVLNQVASGDIRPEDAEKMLGFNRSPRFVITRSGSIALYNLQRYPIVLYVDQWQKVEHLMKSDIFSKFAEKNRNYLKTKNLRANLDPDITV